MTNEELNRIPQPSAKKKKFYANFGHLTDSEVLKEILFAQQIQINRLERTRANTSTLVWFLIALPIIFFVLMFFLGIGVGGF
jgi:predicted nucleic acid-binding Zn ribbon protein